MSQNRIKFKGQVYTTEVLYSQFSLKVQADDIDIWYDYRTQILTAFVNGELVCEYKYIPSRLQFNLINLTDIAVKFRELHYMKRKRDLE